MTTNLLADTFGPHARSSDPDTSRDAARQLEPANDVERIVRFYLARSRRQGWTCSELEGVPELAPLAARHSLTKRLSDALAKGYLEPVREKVETCSEIGAIVRRRSPHGRQQRALRITHEGVRWLGYESAEVLS